MSKRSISELDQESRRWLVWQLQGGGAHAKFDQVVAGFPVERRGKKPRNVPYSAWQLLEHLRLAQEDIVEFCVNPDYVEKAWPGDYWPKSPVPPDERAWEKSIRAIRSSLREMCSLVADPKRDLHAAIKWGQGQTIFREALLLADHEAYHLGEMVLLRRLLGIWPSSRKK